MMDRTDLLLQPNSWVEEMGDGLIVGFCAGILLMILVWVIYILATMRRNRRRRNAETEVLELHAELAQDKEKNRYLSYLLAQTGIITTEDDGFHIPDSESGPTVDDSDQASTSQLERLKKELAIANRRLNDREKKIKEYREALREIRLALESSGKSSALAMTFNPTNETPGTE